MGPIVIAFDWAFDEISKGSRKLISNTPPEILFKDLRGYESTAMCSIGEYVVRSAAMVERAFGGLTRRLWDDPFEWTLPEELYSVPEIDKYLDEVDASRKSGLLFLHSDDDLSKQLPAPQKLKSIADILIEAIAESRHYQGRAFALYQVTCEKKLPIV
jgi:hypothetical protein